MTSKEARRCRVVVCGTTFGQVYLEAVRAHRASFELVGILANGSERSRACADHYGVPLFAEASQLPEHVDVACVVVRSSLLGGRGTELAHRLMARGIHVLQEHPLHHDELAACIREARRHGVQYQLNSFYPHLAAVQRFLRAAAHIFERHPPSYVDATCSVQVAYALLDILRLAFRRVRPWGFAATAPSADLLSRSRRGFPFRSLDGVFGGIPLSLRIEYQIDAGEPDAHAHLFHRIVFGTEAGELVLVSTNGPVVWCARPQIPREVLDPGSRRILADCRMPEDDVSTTLLGSTEERTQGVLFRSAWPEAAAAALIDFCHGLADVAGGLERSQGQLALCRVWQDIAAVLGPPTLLGPAAHASRLSAGEFDTLRRLARDANAPVVS